MRNGQNGRYIPPAVVTASTLQDLIDGARDIPAREQHRFAFHNGPLNLWCAGDESLLRSPCVAVVGTRNVSPAGRLRARRVATELARAGIVVVSGLARGVDTEALTAAVTAGGRVVAVIGTPIDRAYPAENASLQEQIYREHLLISQFEFGGRVFASNFPTRNKLMAALSDATVIVEASDSSGTLHQATECVRLGRPLFVARSTMRDPALTWPANFVDDPGVYTLSRTDQIVQQVAPA